MRQRWNRLCAYLSPPGYDPAAEVGFWLVGNGAAFLFALVSFWTKMERGLENTRINRVFGLVSFPDKMSPFAEVLGGSLWGFAVVALICLALTAVRWGYYYQGSRSIYFMRRLPQRGELTRRTAGLPVLLAMLTLVCAAVMLLGCLAAYWLIVPEEIRPVDQWQSMWNTARGE